MGALRPGRGSRLKDSMAVREPHEELSMVMKNVANEQQEESDAP